MAFFVGEGIVEAFVTLTAGKLTRYEVPEPIIIGDRELVIYRSGNLVTLAFRQPDLSCRRWLPR